VAIFTVTMLLRTSLIQTSFGDNSSRFTIYNFYVKHSKYCGGSVVVEHYSSQQQAFTSSPLLLAVLALPTPINRLQ
jgi:hypothetical protein